MPRHSFSLCGLLLLALAAAPAFADTVTFSGTTAGGPTWNRPRDAGSGTAGSCTLSNIGTAVPFATEPFTVPADGTYDIDLDPVGFDGVLLLYDGRGFDPSDPCLGLIGYADEGFDPGNPEEIAAVGLSAGVSYTVVVTGFDNTDAGAYSGTVCPTEVDAGDLVTAPALDATGQTTITGILDDEDEDHDCYLINITDPDDFEARAVSVLRGAQLTLLDVNREGVAFDDNFRGPRITTANADSTIMRGDHFLCVSPENNSPLNVFGLLIFFGSGATPNPEFGDARFAFWSGNGTFFGNPTLSYEVTLRGVGGAVVFDLDASSGRTNVVPGGFIDFDYRVTNDAAGPATGDVWYEVRRTGFFSNLVLARARLTSGTLPPGGQTPLLSYAQAVPSTTQAGEYVYTIKIGDFASDTAVESERFFITVVAPPSSSRRAVGADIRAMPRNAAFEALLAEARRTGERPADLSAHREAAKAELKALPRGDWSATDVAPWQAETATPAVAARAEAGEVAGTDAVSIHPNPFARRTEIAFSLEEAAEVSLAVYDVRGREVAVLVNGPVEAGRHAVRFDASRLPSGVYVWRLVAGERVETGRVTLVR